MSTASADGGHRLASAESPFLRHGASQPVEWWPWGEEAFRVAREQDRPVLLDIGAVWCHWCHVMDRESYEDTDTAALINQRFIAVKVDRDERPDVDARYQRAVQVLTGQGGWPLTAFLTPDGDVFYGGTYFPPDERYGRPSFRRVLGEVSRIWQEDRPRALDAVRGISDRLSSYSRGEAQQGEPRPGLISETIEELASSFDFRYGGFGSAPKFPSPGALDLLLDHVAEGGPDWARRMITETLDAMGRGGIHDQLGGGFHRYATDARWLIPHFEKMAYDNGPLLTTYAAAFAILRDPLYAAVAGGITEHYRDIAPDLLEAGGFPASQDADIGPDDDGDYWTWSETELRAALGDGVELDAARHWFGMDDPGAAMHHDPSKHVLFQAITVSALAQRLNLETDEAAALVKRIASRLKEVRDGRPAPYVDQSVYSGWTALVASGFLAAARYIGAQTARDTALRALERIWRDAFVQNSGVIHRVGAADSGYVLEDQAYVALACLDAFDVTQKAEWLERATILAAVMRERFQDAETRAFRDRPADAPSPVRTLDVPHLPIADSPTPSGNGAAALALARLGAITGEATYGQAARDVLAAFAGSAARLLSSAASWMKALAWITRPVTHIVIVDGADDAASSKLFHAALSTYRPRTILRWLPPGSSRAGLPPELEAMLGGARPRAYLCAGHTCAAPVQEPEQLVDLIRSFPAG